MKLLHTPGHTPGHLSLLLRLESGGRLLLTADAAYAQRTLDERLLSLFSPTTMRTSRRWTG